MLTTVVVLAVVAVVAAGIAAHKSAKLKAIEAELVKVEQTATNDAAGLLKTLVARIRAKL